MKKIKNVSSQENLVLQEKKWQNFWKENKTFEKSVRGDKNFNFFDGPPFATGLPHYGHLLAGVLKDVVPRYWTMNGYKVPRRFGWDCHGLPVEAEVQKKLGLFSRKDVLAFGVDKFNEECRSVVLKYTNEWKQTVDRVGRWVDMEKPYHTMDVSFMESVWWVFQELYKKNLVYEGLKVVPYSVGLGSVLSNFEANQNYQDVQDTAVTVSFKLNEKPWTLLAWTTTPWTLPANSGLGVNKEFDYSVVSCNEQLYVVVASQVTNVFKGLEHTVVETLKGSDLVGLTYSPLFKFFSEQSLKVVAGDFVTQDSGTGVVHLAPCFGEDDFTVGKKENLPLYNHVDDDGVFTSQCGFLAGLPALNSHKEVMVYLKTNNLLFKQEQVTHSYPFCYRTNTKLMYRAVSSWFVKVEDVKEKMLKNNQTTTWTPEHLRDGRFGKWLEQTRDWAVSRNRFWGTPLPLWKNDEGEVVCVGSKEELEKLTGVKLTDLHSHHVGHLEVPSPTGKSNLKWVGGVLDCWFESGAMPYAQHGYPHTTKNLDNLFPADFVAEGLDQTRGWFYTLMVLGTALFDKAPYKHVMVNGLVLAEDGKKMSKMLKNYPDPNLVLDECGADALRLYLMDSPVVAGEELRFKLQGVKDHFRKNLLRLHNVHSFFANYANVDGYEPKYTTVNSTNVLDQWLLSRLNRLTAEVNECMKNYDLKSVVPKFSQFVEDLTNTYVRFNRSLFWQQQMPTSKVMAYDTLHYTLVTLSKLMAPFTPFMSEEVYNNLSGEQESVHLESFPQADESRVNLNLEEAVQVMTDLVELGRNYREQVKVKSKVPLLSMEVAHRNPEVLASLKKMEYLFLEELNVRQCHYTTDENKYVSWSAKANAKLLGKKLGQKVKDVSNSVQSLNSQQVKQGLDQGFFKVDDLTLSLDEVMVVRNKKENKTEVCFNYSVVVAFDPAVTEEQLWEGKVKEVLRKVQEMRKEMNLQLSDKVNLSLRMNEEFKSHFAKFEAMVKLEALVVNLTYEDKVQGTLVKDFNEELKLDVIVGLSKN